MKQGFTFIELIISVAVIVVVLGISFIFFKNVEPSFKLNENSRMIINDLRLSQQNSVNQQKKYGIKFIAPNSYDFILTQPGTSTLKSVSLSDNVQITDIAGLSGGAVVFSALGEPSDSGSVTLSLSGRTIVVQIKPSGYVKAQK